MSRTLLESLAIVGACGLASAQVPISGALSDATTGPLRSGVVYHAIADLSVPAGATLTIEPGAIVKFQPVGSSFLVQGRLRMGRDADRSTIFTDVDDDSAGGDTNNNGPSTGTPNHWRGIYCGATSDASELEGLVLRYSGWGGAPGILLDQADVALRGCTIERCGDEGLDLNGSTTACTVHDCTFRDNGGVAVNNVPLQAVPGFTDNLASGNGGDFLFVTGTALGADLDIGPQSCLGGALVLGGNLVVPAGVTLTLQPGVIVKWRFDGLYAWCHGTLRTLGTPTQPVVLTSFADDEHGGDTDGNGPTAGVPGSWAGLALDATAGASSLEGLIVRYAGWGYWPGIFLDQADATLRSCTVERCYDEGLDLNGSTTACTVHDCTFRDNGGVAVNNVPLQAVPGFTDNLASGNGGDFLFVTGTALGADLDIGPQSCLGGALVLGGNLVVPAGVTLTLQPGVVVKWRFDGLYASCSGSLQAVGSAQQPVVLTAFADDEHGGDTNKDGNSTLPAPGTWSGLSLEPAAAASVLENVVLRYAGYGMFPALYARSPLLVSSDVRIDHAYGVGFWAEAHAGTAERWRAFGCGASGILLAAGSFDLRQASAVANQSGLQRQPAFTGVVTDSIGWGNTASNFVSFVAGQLLWSDGHPALAGADGNLMLDPLFVDAARGDLRLLEASPCIDSANPFSPPDPDGTRADMGAHPFDHCEPVTYCTPKVSSSGCVPQLTWEGSPSASAASGFFVHAVQIEKGNPGLFFYGLSGPVASPFQGGWMCVKGPIWRTQPKPSGGAAPCSGVLSIDFNAYVASGVNPALVPGAPVCLQAWFRDPADPVSGTGLTGGLRFQICP